MTDAELAACAFRRDPRAVRLVTARNNQRLYRAAWSVLKNRADAEEAVQDAYLKAFAAPASFAGRSSLSTWLTRIVLNEALERKRAAERRKRTFGGDVARLEEYREKFMSAQSRLRSPEAHLIRAELAAALEKSIVRLPEDLRMVFILRDIEEMSVEETAEALGAPAATVKTRHHRARRRLQRDLDPDFRAILAETLRFAGADCGRMTERAVAALCGGAL
jgi:RNA polymerase sigma-70 factor (ECF subfamily)